MKKRTMKRTMKRMISAEDLDACAAMDRDAHVDCLVNSIHHGLLGPPLRVAVVAMTAESPTRNGFMTSHCRGTSA